MRRRRNHPGEGSSRHPLRRECPQAKLSDPGCASSTPALDDDTYIRGGDRQDGVGRTGQQGRELLAGFPVAITCLNKFPHGFDEHKRTTPAETSRGRRRKHADQRAIIASQDLFDGAGSEIPAPADHPQLSSCTRRGSARRVWPK